MIDCAPIDIFPTHSFSYGTIRGKPPDRTAMSPFVRYALAALIAVYGFYQVSNDRLVPGIIGVALGALLVWWISTRQR
jgi:hypothetical protein